MAVIDLKFATVTIRDGSTGLVDGIDDAGAVNNVAGYPAGSGTMLVDGLTGAVANGQTFTVTGETGSPTHTVTGHSETTGNTTSVSFTPVLASTVADAVAVTFVSNPIGTNSIEVKIGEGTLSYTEKRNMEYRRDRGVLSTVREGDEEPIEVNFDFEWEFLRSGTGEDVTIEEALKKTGAAFDWVSSSADICEPYSVDIVVNYIPPCSDADTEIIVLQDFRWETLDHNLKDGQISAKGQCNVKEALVTRQAQASVMSSVARQQSPNRLNKSSAKIVEKRQGQTQATAPPPKEKVKV